MRILRKPLQNSTTVELYHNGKTQTSLIKQYGVSQSAITRWIKQYSTVETDNGEILTAKQVKELQKRLAQIEEENLILKKAIAIFMPHSKSDQKPVYKLRKQHQIKTLCRVLKLNRSTYYKHFYSDPAPRTCENQVIRKYILQICLDYDNSLCAYKIRRVLERDYGILISLGRVCQLMNTMNLPKRSTEKPKLKVYGKTNG